MRANTHFFNPETRKFWYCILAFRLFLAINSRSRFHADEHQQSVEVAYHMVFGGGCLPWEWNPNHALRQVFHPLIYAVIFKLLNFFRMDYTTIIIYSPNVLHAIFLFWCDYRFYQLIKDIYDSRIAKISLLIYLISWFSCICMIKTFSNTIEAGLLIIGISYWYKIKNSCNQEIENNKNNSKREMLNNKSSLIDYDCIMLTITITSTFILRTTSIISWIVPMFYMVFFLKTFKKFLLCDGLYSKPTLTFLNFLWFNVLTEGSNYFGVSSKYEYITLLAFLQVHVFYPLLAIGMYLNAKEHLKKRTFPMFLCITVFYVGVLSMIAHKEMRFALPVFYLQTVFIHSFIVYAIN